MKTQYLVITEHPNLDNKVLLKFGIETDSMGNGYHIFSTIDNMMTYLKLYQAEFDADMLKSTTHVTTSGRYLDFLIRKIILDDISEAHPFKEFEKSEGEIL